MEQVVDSAVKEFDELKRRALENSRVIRMNLNSLIRRFDVSEVVHIFDAPVKLPDFFPDSVRSTVSYSKITRLIDIAITRDAIANYGVILPLVVAFSPVSRRLWVLDGGTRMEALDASKVVDWKVLYIDKDQFFDPESSKTAMAVALSIAISTLVGKASRTVACALYNKFKPFFASLGLTQKDVMGSVVCVEPVEGKTTSELRDIVGRAILLLDSDPALPEDVKTAGKALLMKLNDILSLRARIARPKTEEEKETRKGLGKLIVSLKTKIGVYVKEEGGEPDVVLKRTVVSLAGDLLCYGFEPPSNDLKRALERLLRTGGVVIDYKRQKVACKAKLRKLLLSLGLSEALANEILEALERARAWASKRPPVVAATVLDYIRSITALPIKQTELARMFAVTEVAIRQRKSDITEVLQPLAEKIRAELAKQQQRTNEQASQTSNINNEQTHTEA
ncbi:MAG: hypothetical protein L7H05_01490 [Vulcanisaeta sp.]|nr:hypothetical protein [Vulcanisaeta sp.]